jgi:hypothetical protein
MHNIFGFKTRTIFSDFRNSPIHVLLGVLGSFFSFITVIFTGYQLWQYSRDKNENVVVDLAEYFVALAIIYFIV